jgi:serine phosphatase RsbU (regulator of sigma subunit)
MTECHHWPRRGAMGYNRGMRRLIFDSSDAFGPGPSPFKPDTYRPTVERFAHAAGVALSLEPEPDRADPDRPFYPVRLAARRTGWCVVPGQKTPSAVRIAELAAYVVSRTFKSDQDVDSLATEVSVRYEELNFLYSMGERVGALLTEAEVCSYVVEEAAWLMDCERASLMLPEPETGLLHVTATVGMDEEIAGSVRVRPGEGISGRVFETGVAAIVNDGDSMPADSLSTRGLSKAGCFLCVPLMINVQGSGPGNIIGVFNLTSKRDGTMFTASDLKLLQAVVSTTTTQIQNCRLISAEHERARLAQELAMAARIQLSLLPTAPIERGCVRVAGFSKPAQHVGGDMYDYWMQGDHLCMVIADVSGHDMGAALMAAALRSVLRSETAHGAEAASLMTRVNSALLRDLIAAELFISVFYAEIHPDSGRMTYCRAGHPLPLLLESEGARWLDTEGILLGICEDAAFEQGVVQMQPGDSLLFFTDGLVEAESDDGFFGVQGIEAAARRAAALPPAQMARAIAASAEQHVAPDTVHDDMTVMVLRVDDGQERP